MEISLTLTTAGIDTGPFNLYSNVDGYVTLFKSGVSRADLVTGYITNDAPVGTTVVRVQSTGYCTNYVDIDLFPATTTSTTSTTTCPTYYELAGCLPGYYAFTTVVPTLGIGQRFILPESTIIYYTYTGVSNTTCIVPLPYNSSIQATGDTGCPT
jgi:hypothetical protein